MRETKEIYFKLEHRAARWNIFYPISLKADYFQQHLTFPHRRRELFNIIC